MPDENGSRNWHLLMRVASLVLIFGVVALGHPEVSRADGGGCAEAMGKCASEGYCEDHEGDKDCEEGDCTGVEVCVQDTGGECVEYPGCQTGECQVLICANWDT